MGTDIVSVARIAALLQQSGDLFLQRWFTAAEIAYCTAKAVPSRHLAARMAAKEAVLKALPFAWTGGPLPWQSIEIVNDEHGQPGVLLHGGLREAGGRAGVGTVRISMSHCDEYATAVATLTLVREPAAPAARKDDRLPDRGLPDCGHLAEVLAEWRALNDSGANADPQLQALRLAVLLEDTLGARLTDDDIDLQVLTDPDAVRSILARKGGGG